MWVCREGAVQNGTPTEFVLAVNVDRTRLVRVHAESMHGGCVCRRAKRKQPSSKHPMGHCQCHATGLSLRWTITPAVRVCPALCRANHCAAVAGWAGARGGRRCTGGWVSLVVPSCGQAAHSKRSAHTSLTPLPSPHPPCLSSASPAPSRPSAGRTLLPPTSPRPLASRSWALKTARVPRPLRSPSLSAPARVTRPPPVSPTSSRTLRSRCVHRGRQQQNTELAKSSKQALRTFAELVETLELATCAHAGERCECAQLALAAAALPWVECTLAIALAGPKHRCLCQLQRHLCCPTAPSIATSLRRAEIAFALYGTIELTLTVDCRWLAPPHCP